MSLRTLKFASAESLVGIRRNALMSFASVVTMALTLAILGAISLLVLGLNNLARTQLQKFEVAVFVEKGTAASDVKALESKISKLPHVRSMELVTADEAWREFRKGLSEKVELSGIKGNPLPDTFRVRVDDPVYTELIAKSIRNMEHVDEVNEASQEIKQVMSIADLLRLVGAIAVLLLFLATSFIVGNTIRMTIYARRREIHIMQLVGATNWFIRLPFFLEGMLLGTLGGGAACLLVYGGTRYISQVAVKIMPLLSQFSSDVDPVRFFGSLLVLGLLLGALSSLVSVRRCLKA